MARSEHAAAQQSFFQDDIPDDDDAIIKLAEQIVSISRMFGRLLLTWPQDRHQKPVPDHTQGRHARPSPSRCHC